MMKSLPTSSKLILLLTCMALTATAAAQSSAAFEQHVVHYNAMNASLLPPEVAQQYNIQRSTSRGLINITVLEKVLALPNKPVHAVVKVTARNLTGKWKNKVQSIIWASCACVTRKHLIFMSKSPPTAATNH
jgi:hypothetical protein